MKATFVLISRVEMALRLFGLDVCVAQDDPRCSLFDFERSDRYPDGSREYWGLGFHVVVSPLR